MEERMFVAIARFPEVPTEREAEFRAWFAWSNDQLRDIDGLQSRRLLRASDGSYTAIVEQKSAESFAAMRATEVASQVHAQLAELLLDEPAATTHEVVVDLANAGPAAVV
jgi:heme-degrading monooxygenase HmoA